jgi:hypothetical protein
MLSKSSEASQTHQQSGHGSVWPAGYSSVPGEGENTESMHSAATTEPSSPRPTTPPESRPPAKWELVRDALMQVAHEDKHVEAYGDILVNQIAIERFLRCGLSLLFRDLTCQVASLPTHTSCMHSSHAPCLFKSQNAEEALACSRKTCHSFG